MPVADLAVTSMVNISNEFMHKQIARDITHVLVLNDNNCYEQGL